MNIKELQELYFNAFVILKSFCENNQLTLYPVGGTLLGIVRFGDFIPWDDDLDLAMPRSDYEILYTMRGHLLKEGLILERYKCSRGFPYPYIKILFKEVIFTHILDVNFGFDNDLIPAIDLYPIDSVGDTIDEAMVKMYYVNKVKRLYDVKVTPINWIKNPLKRVVAALVHLLPLKYILACYDHCMAKEARESLVTRWRGPNYEKHIYKRSLWFETIKMPFRKMSIDCPAGYDEILRDIYGEYTKPYTYLGDMRHAAEKNDVRRRYLERVKRDFYG